MLERTQVQKQKAQQVFYLLGKLLGLGLFPPQLTSTLGAADRISSLARSVNFSKLWTNI